MKNSSKISKAILVGSMMLGLALTTTPAATAHTSSGNASPAATAEQGSDTKQQKVQDRLERLAAKQSQKEIDEVLGSGVGGTVLIDPATGRVTAAELPDPNQIEPLVYQIGPGCTTTSLCVRGSSFYGFEQAGTMSGYWPGAHSFNTGSWSASLGYTYFGNQAYTDFVPRNFSGVFSGGATVTMNRVSLR